MTQDQAMQLLAAVADLQQIGMALGAVLGSCVIFLNIACILLCGVIFFQALRRS